MLVNNAYLGAVLIDRKDEFSLDPSIGGIDPESMKIIEPVCQFWTP